MAQTRTYDQGTVTKYSFLTAVGLFVVGVLGEVVLPLAVGGLPGWEQTLFADLEAVGIVLALFSVFGFGILWPLLE